MKTYFAITLNTIDPYSLIATTSGVIYFVCTIAVVYLALKKWDPALRKYIANKLGVEIDLSGKGQWQVVTSLSWYKKLAIELLQLVLYMFLFLLWAVGAIALVIILSLLEKFYAA